MHSPIMFEVTHLPGVSPAILAAARRSRCCQVDAIMESGDGGKEGKG